MARALGKGGVAKLVWKSESGGERVGKKYGRLLETSEKEETRESEREKRSQPCRANGF